MLALYFLYFPVILLVEMGLSDNMRICGGLLFICSPDQHCRGKEYLRSKRRRAGEMQQLN